MDVSHLQCGDDNILVLEANTCALVNAKKDIYCFERVNGLKVITLPDAFRSVHLNISTPDHRCRKPINPEHSRPTLFISQLLINSHPLFPGKMVWISYLPLKVWGFVWEAMWRKSTTADHFQRSNPQYWISPNMFMCTGSEETASHLLLHCPIIYSSWTTLSI